MAVAEFDFLSKYTHLTVTGAFLLDGSSEQHSRAPLYTTELTRCEAQSCNDI